MRSRESGEKKGTSQACRIARRVRWPSGGTSTGADLETDFEIDHYQPIYYVLESFEQLRDAMNEYAERVLEQRTAVGTR